MGTNGRLHLEPEERKQLDQIELECEAALFYQSLEVDEEDFAEKYPEMA